MPTDHFRGVAKNQASLFRTHPTQIQIRCQPTAEGIPAPPRQVSVLNLLADFIFCTAQVDSFPPIREQPDQRRDHWVPTHSHRLYVTIELNLLLAVLAGVYFVVRKRWI